MTQIIIAGAGGMVIGVMIFIFGMIMGAEAQKRVQEGEEAKWRLNNLGMSQGSAQAMKAPASHAKTPTSKSGEQGNPPSRAPT